MAKSASSQKPIKMNKKMLNKINRFDYKLKRPRFEPYSKLLDSDASMVEAGHIGLKKTSYSKC